MNPLIAIEHLIFLAPLVVFAGTFLAWRSAPDCWTATRIGITLSRMFALGMLVVLALNIGAWRTLQRTTEKSWAVLIDNSQSMATADMSGSSRIQAAVKTVEELRQRVDEDSHLVTYSFSSGVGERLDGDALAVLRADGAATDIERAGRELLGRWGNRKNELAGIILLSDGRQLNMPKNSEFALRARSLQAGIYAIPLGGMVEQKDLALDVQRQQWVTFAGEQVRLGCHVENSGLANITARLRLRIDTGNLLQERTVTFEQPGRQPVFFNPVLEVPGYHRLTIEVESLAEESRLVNNRKTVGVTVLDSQIRILTVEGAPYWDSKFLVQLLRSQRNLDVTSVYRISAERFFKVDTADQRVSGEQAGIFPANASELSKYDVIIFGKGAEYFLDVERVALLKNFLRQQGGTVLFARGKPYNRRLPELGAIEPVEWGEPGITRQFSVQPTRAGADAGLFGDMLPGPDASVWAKLPTLEQAHACERIKGFAEVMLESRIGTGTESQRFPIICTRRYGKGLVVTVNAEGLWHWDFFPSVAEADSLYEDIWVQLLHWAVSYSEFLPGHKYSLRMNREAFNPDEVVHVRIRRRNYDRLAAAPRLRITGPNGFEQSLDCLPSRERDLGYSAHFTLKHPGYYRVQVVAEQGDQDNGVQSMILVRGPPAEKDNVSAAPEYLANLAAASGGKVMSRAGLFRRVAENGQPEFTESPHKAVWEPAWDQWWILGLIAGLFSTEWFMRRRSGLL